MSKVLLPLQVPPVVTYLHHAYPLSIMMEDPKSPAWLYSHYIQLYFPIWEQNRMHATDFNFYHYNYPLAGQYISPFIYHKQFSMKMIQKYGTLRDYVIDSIDQLDYVSVNCDEYYIPHRSAYMKRHHIHNNMIYGYDLETREYYIYGYDENGTFRNTKVSFQQFEESAMPSEHFDVSWYDMVMTYSRWDAHFEFDIEPVIELLKDYVLGRDTSLRYGIRMFPTNKKFGKDVYPMFMQYLQAVQAGAMELDIRPFHLLWEHKKLMLDRIQYLIENGLLEKDSELHEAYATVERACFGIRGDVLKANTAQSMTFLATTGEAMQAISVQEVAVLTRLIEELEAKAFGGNAADAAGEWESAVEFQF